MYTGSSTVGIKRPVKMRSVDLVRSKRAVRARSGGGYSQFLRGTSLAHSCSLARPPARRAVMALVIRSSRALHSSLTTITSLPRVGFPMRRSCAVAGARRWCQPVVASVDYSRTFASRNSSPPPPPPPDETPREGAPGPSPGMFSIFDKLGGFKVGSPGSGGFAAGLAFVALRHGAWSSVLAHLFYEPCRLDFRNLCLTPWCTA